MCTAVTYKTKNFYFGRNLDIECSYNEEITFTPRKYPFSFRDKDEIKEHFSIIGMAHVEDNYPLYYDAVNEKGLSMAALNFVGNAYYKEVIGGKDNIAHFELIPWILGQCSSVYEAITLLNRINLTNKPFSSKFPLSYLHWIIADKDKTITFECTKEGLKVYDNSIGVLTNNPTFDIQMFNLNNYINISKNPPMNHFADSLPLDTYSRGMGGIGLPGDLSSQSRFVRASFVKLNSVSGDTEKESVSQFFHILDSVYQQKGCCRLEDNLYEITLYSSCINTNEGIYYYTTYENRQITAVDMKKENPDSSSLVRYPLITSEQIRFH